MTTAIPDHSINYFTPLAPSAPCSVGQVMIPSTVGAYFVVATTANRGSRGSEGVAVTAWSGPPESVGTVKLKQNGILPAEQSLLGTAASRKLVRCSATGSIERIDSYTAGDDVIGYAEADGRVHLHFGLPWSIIAAAAGVSPSGPALAYQHELSGVFGASALLKRSADAAGVEFSTAKGGVVAASGDMRITTGGAEGAQWNCKFANPYAPGKDVTVFYAQSYTDNFTENVIGFGAFSVDPQINPDIFFIQFNRLCGWDYTTATPEGNYVGMVLDSWTGSGPYPAWQHRRSLTLNRYTNFAILGTRDHLANPEEAFGLGEGVFYHGWASINPTSNPTQGVTHFVNKTGATATVVADNAYYRRPSGRVAPAFALRGTKPIVLAGPATAYTVVPNDLDYLCLAFSGLTLEGATVTMPRPADATEDYWILVENRSDGVLSFISNAGQTGINAASLNFHRGAECDESTIDGSGNVHRYSSMLRVTHDGCYLVPGLTVAP